MRSLTVTLGANDQLQLFVPGMDAEGHHVNIPLTVDGLRLIRKILRERARQPKPRIGMDSAPTQAQVNAWLRAEAERRLEAQRALGVETEKLLEELGL